MLVIDGLRKVYGAGDDAVEAIAGIDVEFRAQAFTCIVGPSGCGKTTLPKCMAGLLAPTEGSVTLHGAPVTGPPRQMALVFRTTAARCSRG